MRIHALPALLVLPLLSVPAGFAEEAKSVSVGKIELQIPADWEKEPPSNRLRLAQWNLPQAKGDEQETELVVSTAGGGIDPNLQRWVSQFAGNKEVKITEGESKQGKYYLADISGTYNMPVGPPILRKTQPLEDARMIGVILLAKADKNVYFLKAAGPEATVSAQMDAIRASFGGDASKEKNYSIGG